jgi:hypothetical protein
MIIVKLKGGLGNQMFQYAIGRALSIKHNTSLGLDLNMLLDRSPTIDTTKFTFYDYNLDVFNIDPKIVSKNEIPLLNRKKFGGMIGRVIEFIKVRILKNPGLERNFTFDPTVALIGPDTYLDGFWQSEKYFSEVEDIIRKDFTLKNPLPENVQTLINEIKTINSVSIHVRRGDYVGNPVYDFIGQEYYSEGIKKIESLRKIDKIYVFSNDIKWCKDNLFFPYPTMYVGEEYAGEKDTGHLFLMAACHNLIIANSSFSWWAAWLSSYKDKIVISPKQWFGKGSIDTHDLIPENWIRI